MQETRALVVLGCMSGPHCKPAVRSIMMEIKLGTCKPFLRALQRKQPRAGLRRGEQHEELDETPTRLALASSSDKRGAAASVDGFAVARRHGTSDHGAVLHGQWSRSADACKVSVVVVTILARNMISMAHLGARVL